jgi:HK97 family phage major capsid protein
MTSNTDLMSADLSPVHKAELALADIAHPNGLLYPSQAERFVEVVVEEAVLMNNIDVQTIPRPEHEINFLHWPLPILYPGQEGRALPDAQRVAPELTGTSFAAKLFRGAAPITDEVLEDTMARDELRDQIMTSLTAAVARDMDDLALNGDTSSLDPRYQAFNGFLKQATSHVVAVAGASGLDYEVLKDVLKELPKAFRQRKDLLTYVTGTDAEIEYADLLGERATGMGDRYLQEAPPGVYQKIPVMGVPMLPEDGGGGSNETSVLLTQFENMTIGIYRRMKIEVWRDPRVGKVYVLIRIRFDAKFKFEDAVAKATGVLTS